MSAAADRLMSQLILFNVSNGLIVGAFYALMALGLSLILNLSGVINFAHGGFLALGAYFAYTLTPYIGFWGALILAPILTGALGLIIERLLIRPLYGTDPLYSLLLTFGLAYMIEDGAKYVWGAQSLPFQPPIWLMQPLSLESVRRQASAMELEVRRFYEKAAARTRFGDRGVIYKY